MRTELEATYRRLAPSSANCQRRYLTCLFSMVKDPKAVVANLRRRIFFSLLIIVVALFEVSVSDFPSAPWMEPVLLVLAGTLAGMLRFQIHAYRNMANMVGIVNWEEAQARAKELGMALEPS